MLWTDGLFVTSTDLATIDPEVSDVAAAENFTIDGATGVAQRTITEAGLRLLGQMQRFGGYLSSGLVSANHLAAVFNVGGPGVNRTRVILGQIVANDLVGNLKNWMMYETLANCYRAALARVDSAQPDRYRTKMNDYLDMIRRVHWPNLQNIGLPVVYRPMPCPGAINERNSGSWGSANVTTVSAGGASGGSFYVAITYVDQSFWLNPQNKFNSESFLSAVVGPVTVASAHALSISIASLNPPNGQATAPNLPLAITNYLNASGWNVWVAATAGGPFFLQNNFPIPISTLTYSLAGDPVLSGVTSDNGQYPDAYYTMQETLQRG